MNASKSESLQLVDHLAKTAHEMVDNMHERAVKMEGELTKQSKETGDQIAAGLESRMGKLEGYIADNPMAAAMIAFGLGAFGTRMFKSVDTAGWAKQVSGGAAPGKKAGKASVSKAA